jgi:hypothetical protein
MTTRSTTLSDLKARDAENPQFQAAYTEAKLRFTLAETARLSSSIRRRDGADADLTEKSATG